MQRWLSTGSGARACAALGAVTIAFSSILVKLSHASPSTAAIFRCAYALPVLGLLAFAEDRRFGARHWRDRRAALAAGVFLGVDLILWHRSIEDVGAGLATVLANIQVVLVPLVAWAVLSERPGRRVLMALPVALGGVVLISGVLEAGAYGADPTAGAISGFAAGATYVGFLLLLRRAGVDLRHRKAPRARRPASLDARHPIHPAAGPLFDATLVAGLTAAIMGAAIGDARFVPVWPGAGWLILLALSSQVFGWLLITTSLPRLPAATTSLLLMIQPVGSLFLGALILSERPSGFQLGGVLLVLGAVVFATRPVTETGRARVPGSAARSPARPPA